MYAIYETTIWHIGYPDIVLLNKKGCSELYWIGLTAARTEAETVFDKVFASYFRCNPSDLSQLPKIGARRRETFLTAFGGGRRRSSLSPTGSIGFVDRNKLVMYGK